MHQNRILGWLHTLDPCICPDNQGALHREPPVPDHLFQLEPLLQSHCPLKKGNPNIYGLETGLFTLKIGGFWFLGPGLRKTFSPGKTMFPCDASSSLFLIFYFLGSDQGNYLILEDNNEKNILIFALEPQFHCRKYRFNEK